MLISDIAGYKNITGNMKFSASDLSFFLDNYILDTPLSEALLLQFDQFTKTCHFINGDNGVGGIKFQNYTTTSEINTPLYLKRDGNAVLNGVECTDLTVSGTTVLAASSSTTFEAQTATISSSLTLLPDVTVNWGNYTIPDSILENAYVTLTGGVVADTLQVGAGTLNAEGYTYPPAAGTMH
jgi:hypothetical protein